MSKLTLDIPNEVTDKLKIKAKAHRRSLTQEILFLLEEFANDSINSISNSISLTLQPDQLQPPQPQSDVTLAQLKEMGVKDLSLAHARQAQEKTLSPVEQQLKQERLRQLRYKYIKQKVDEIFPEAKADSDYYHNTLLPLVQMSCIDADDDVLTNKIKTIKDGYLYQPENTEDIYIYQTEIEEREEKLLKPHITNETYRKIKAYALKNDLTEMLYSLIERPQFCYDNVSQSVEDQLLRPALGTPPYNEYTYNQEELDDLTESLSWQE